jgi:hypothetical protein
MDAEADQKQIPHRRLPLVANDKNLYEIRVFYELSN